MGEEPLELLGAGLVRALAARALLLLAPAEVLRSGEWTPEEAAAAAAAAAAGPDEGAVAKVVGRRPALVLRVAGGARLAVRPAGRAMRSRLEALEPLLAAALASVRRTAEEDELQADRYRNIAILYEVSRRLDPQQPAAALAETVLANLHPLIPYDAAGLLIADEGRATLAVHEPAPLGEATRAAFRAQLLHEHESYCLSPTPLEEIEDVAVGPAHSEAAAAAAEVSRWRSVLSVPLILRGGVFAGHLLLASAGADISDSAHFQLVSTIVNHLNAVLTNRRLMAELERQAKVDGMTGVFNYRTFRSVLAREFGRAKRYGKPLSLLIGDVDHFKAVNDTYGHQAGDKVLRGVAAVLDENRRGVDTVARYGGEEFAVVLPETDAEGALALAERLRIKVRDAPLLGSRRVTISIGVATMVAATGSEDGLVGAADRGLYRAKREGRDRVATEEPGPGDGGCA